MFYQDLFGPLGTGAESEDKAPQEGCYIAENVTWGLDLKERMRNEI